MTSGSNSKRILLIGPMPPPVNGQSNCFKLVVDSIPDAVVVDRNVDQMSLFPKTMKYGCAFAKTIITLLSARPSLVYISLSRSVPGLFCDSITILLASLFNTEVYGHLHGNDFLDTRMKQIVFRRIYKMLSSMIVLSPAMVSRMNARVEAPVKVLINPVDEKFLRSICKPDDDIIRVIFFSNFMRSKGIEHFFKLATEFETDSTFEFHIIGDIRADYLSSIQEMRKDFYRWIEKSCNVHYHGSLSNQSLVQKLGDMDVMIFPSFHFSEAFPLTILECAASAQFIVVNDHNDLPIFKEILPQVHVCNTTEYERLSKWLKSQNKRDLQAKGLENALATKPFSSVEHVKNLKEILAIN